MFGLGSADLPLTGLLTALGSVFAGSLGIPLPTFAVLIFAGSLLAVTSHGIEFGALMVVVGMTCALVGDIGWFTVGRIYRTKILHFVCRLSLSRDTCARNTAELFARRGLYLLLFSRFLPGLSLVTSPLAGASAVTMPRFVLYDALGAAVWIGVGLAIGFIFAQQIVMVLVVLKHFGLDLGEAAVTLAVAFIGYKWFQRRLLIHQLRFARISVEELNRLIAAQRAPVIVDVRSELQRNADPFRIPGALLLQQVALERAIRHDPKGCPVRRWWSGRCATAASPIFIRWLVGSMHDVPRAFRLNPLTRRSPEQRRRSQRHKRSVPAIETTSLLAQFITLGPTRRRCCIRECHTDADLNPPPLGREAAHKISLSCCKLIISGSAQLIHCAL